MREQKINPRTALKLQEDEIDELAKDDKIARRELHTALEEFKEAASKQKELRGGAPEAKAEAAPPPTAVDPNVTRLFIAAAGDAEPWTREGIGDFSRWWDKKMLPAFQEDRRASLRAMCTDVVDGPHLLGRCCSETTAPPWVRVTHAPGGKKLDLTFGFRTMVNNHLYATYGLGFYHVLWQACETQGMTPMGDYEWLELLGEGGYGQVHKVRHRHTGKVFALKIVKVDTAKADAMQKASREISLQQKAGEASEHIVSVLVWGQAGEQFLFFTMELCAGGSLRQYVIKDKGIADRGGAARDAPDPRRAARAPPARDRAPRPQAGERAAHRRRRRAHHRLGPRARARRRDAAADRRRRHARLHGARGADAALLEQDGHLLDRGHVLRVCLRQAARHERRGPVRRARQRARRRRHEAHRRDRALHAPLDLGAYDRRRSRRAED